MVGIEVNIKFFDNYIQYLVAVMECW